MSNSAIAASGLRKAYGDKIVLDGIDLDVRAGTVFSLLGPNGAGKTTTVNVLTTLLKADGGSALVGRHDIASETKAVRAAIGVTGQFAAVDELLTGQENLQLMADLKRTGAREGKRVIADLLERFDLTESAGKLVSAYSGGMRRKLDLAMTLIGGPQVIFLDEPTTGLDPRSRRAMWDIVRGLVAGGVSVFLTTQYLDEADQLASRIAVLDQGRIVAQGPPRNSSARSRAVTSGSGSPASPNSTPRRGSCPAPPGTRRTSPCGCQATAACSRCRPCSAGSRITRSARQNCPCTPRTSMTSSSPSPGTRTLGFQTLGSQTRGSQTQR